MAAAFLEGGGSRRHGGGVEWGSPSPNSGGKLGVFLGIMFRVWVLSRILADSHFQEFRESFGCTPEQVWPNSG